MATVSVNNVEYVEKRTRRPQELNQNTSITSLVASENKLPRLEHVATTKASPFPYLLSPRRRLRPTDTGPRPVVGDKMKNRSFRLPTGCFFSLLIKY